MVISEFSVKNLMIKEPTLQNRHLSEMTSMSLQDPSLGKEVT